MLLAGHMCAISKRTFLTTLRINRTKQNANEIVGPLPVPYYLICALPDRKKTISSQKHMRCKILAIMQHTQRLMSTSHTSLV